MQTAETYDGVCFFVDDPTRYEVNDNAVSWYVGGKGEYTNYLEKIILKISKVYNIKFNNITLIGSSNAGFAAIKLANKILGAKSIALNPQINISLYPGKSKDFENRVDMSFNDEKYHSVLYADDFIYNKHSKFFLFFNKSSSVDAIQLSYLQKLIGKDVPNGFSKIKDNIFCEIVDIDATDPHNVVPNEQFIPIIEKIMDDSVPVDTKRDMAIQIVKEMKQYYTQNKETVA